jgi:hypothetical protein
MVRMLMCMLLMSLVHLQHIYRPDGPLATMVFSRNEDGDMVLDPALLAPFIQQARKYLNNTHGCIAAITDLEDISAVSLVLEGAGLHLHFRFIFGELDVPADGRLFRKPYFEVSPVPQSQVALCKLKILFVIVNRVMSLLLWATLCLS